ncbi:nucleotidyltransferase domain-containing protein [candidate division KSB1 bacterium]|nr:nucleotidyltransferase domain-containing protein [candidate division KSB1 bacterium]MBL7095167.1 nucleotidyltransferase domain-containing protein [candidate division KSB1 bacterium]
MNRKKLFSEINKDMVNLFGDKLMKIILYGSYAKNSQNKESDIDFFVLVDDTDENLRKNKYRIADIMADLSLNYDILVSITEETYNRYREYSEILPFYKNVTEEGIEIYGK